MEFGKWKPRDVRRLQEGGKASPVPRIVDIMAKAPNPGRWLAETIDKSIGDVLDNPYWNMVDFVPSEYRNTDLHDVGRNVLLTVKPVSETNTDLVYGTLPEVEAIPSWFGTYDNDSMEFQDKIYGKAMDGSINPAISLADTYRITTHDEGIWPNGRIKDHNSVVSDDLLERVYEASREAGVDFYQGLASVMKETNGLGWFAGTPDWRKRLKRCGLLPMDWDRDDAVPSYLLVRYWRGVLPDFVNPYEAEWRALDRKLGESRTFGEYREKNKLLGQAYKSTVKKAQGELRKADTSLLTRAIHDAWVKGDYNPGQDDYNEQLRRHVKALKTSPELKEWLDWKEGRTKKRDTSKLRYVKWGHGGKVGKFDGGGKSYTIWNVNKNEVAPIWLRDIDGNKTLFGGEYNGHPVDYVATGRDVVANAGNMMTDNLVSHWLGDDRDTRYTREFVADWYKDPHDANGSYVPFEKPLKPVYPEADVLAMGAPALKGAARIGSGLVGRALSKPRMLGGSVVRDVSTAADAAIAEARPFADLSAGEFARTPYFGGVLSDMDQSLRVQREMAEDLAGKYGYTGFSGGNALPRTLNDVARIALQKWPRNRDQRILGNVRMDGNLFAGITDTEVKKPTIRLFFGNWPPGMGKQAGVHELAHAFSYNKGYKALNNAIDKATLSPVERHGRTGEIIADKVYLPKIHRDLLHEAYPATEHASVNAPASMWATEKYATNNAVRRFVLQEKTRDGGLWSEGWREKLAGLKPEDFVQAVEVEPGKYRYNTVFTRMFQKGMLDGYMHAFHNTIGDIIRSNPENAKGLGEAMMKAVRTIPMATGAVAGAKLAMENAGNAPGGLDADASGLLAD